MSESDVRQHAEDIHNQLPDRIDVTTSEIEDRLTSFVAYQVPLDEARRSVISHYRDETDADRAAIDSDTQEIDLAAIDAPEQWVDVTAKVVDLWEPRSDAIAQVGLFGDENGTIKFTAWATSDLPALTEGHVYHLGNVVTDEYQGQYSVTLNRTTTIDEGDRDIEVGDNSTAVEGALVAIQRGSGLIKRCPEEDCTRVLQNGRCADHGEGEGEGDFDLRIKGVIDDGDTVQAVIFDHEMTEDVTAISLAEAEEMAMEALDTAVVADEIQRKTLGRYYRVEGPVMGRYLLVNAVDAPEETPDPAALLTRARGIGDE
jgi:replication factor A1